jgi:hypothetical protein
MRLKERIVFSLPEDHNAGVAVHRDGCGEGVGGNRLSTVKRSPAKAISATVGQAGEVSKKTEATRPG